MIFQLITENKNGLSYTQSLGSFKSPIDTLLKATGKVSSFFYLHKILNSALHQKNKGISKTNQSAPGKLLTVTLAIIKKKRPPPNIKL